jgi:hypothetical protein
MIMRIAIPPNRQKVASRRPFFMVPTDPGHLHPMPRSRSDAEQAEFLIARDAAQRFIFQLSAQHS